MTTGLKPTTEAQRHAPSSGYNSPATRQLLLLPVLLLLSLLLGFDMAGFEALRVQIKSNDQNTKVRP